MNAHTQIRRAAAAIASDPDWPEIIELLQDWRRQMAERGADEIAEIIEDALSTAMYEHDNMIENALAEAEAGYADWRRDQGE